MPGTADPWADLAARVLDWLGTVGVDARETVVLLPYAALLPLARRAFAQSGGWLPRIETTLTLAAALGPPAPADGVRISGDVTLDLLLAARLLRSQRESRLWERRDPRGFDRAAASLVETAHALLQAAAALPPAAREAHWALARQQLAPLAGPGGRERLLARLALEWAALAPAPLTDRLDALRPAAWVAVRAGGADALTDRLLADADVPGLRIDTDPDAALPFALRHVDVAPPVIAVCDGFEAEAAACAAQVVEHVRHGQVPVALIAQDRVLVRRVRALLEREAVRVQDETGWRLSTTRAAALVMALLRAARPQAPSDALLDWLKALPDRDPGFARALDAFEARLRRYALASVAAVARHAAEVAAEASWSRLWTLAAAVLAPLADAPPQALPAWLAALRRALEGCEAWRALENDTAGRQLITALRLDADTVDGGAWRLVAGDAVTTLAGFTDWVDAALERATYTLVAEVDGPAEVVITPLARAMLRPFAAAVFPGADANHLGATPPPQSLIGEAQAQALGLPDAARRREVELLAFGQLLRVPRLTLLRRRSDGSEPVADSPLVARLALALAARGSALAPWHDPRVARPIASTPQHPTAPTGAGALLPSRLSASACEALRACPYRFFALHLLRLNEHDELDGEVRKRDYGTWLHAVLHTFHRGRVAPASVDEETANLLNLAEASRVDQRIDEADFVPFLASFATFAPRYVVWLHDRDAAGWRWSEGEREVVVEPEGFDGTQLRGIIDRIDRIDVASDAGARVTELIDYKTGSAAGLREKVREPLEDTQLAFYAALLPDAAPLEAVYLALDGTKGIETIRHPDVRESAAALLTGLADDLRQIRAGAALPALGTGAACTWCAARGVCRRDDWAADEAGA